MAALARATRALALLAALASSAGAHAQALPDASGRPTTTPPATATPAAPSAAGPAPWTIGVARLTVKGDSPMLAYMASSIPLRVLDGLASAKTRTMTEGEMAALRDAARLKGLYEKGSELARRMKELDEFLFTSPDSVRRKASETAIADARKKLEEAIAGTPPAVDVARQVKFWPGHAEGRLVERDGPPSAVADKNGLDALVYGSVEEVEGYVFVTLTLYARSLDAELGSDSEACAPDDTGALVERFVAKARPLVLGRKAGTVAVTATPYSALIELDGSFAGSGFFSSDSVDPGRHRLRVSAPGFRDAILEFDLPEGGRLERGFALEAVEAVKVDVATEPAGAAVYVDGFPAGKAPLTVDATSGPFILYALMEGHESRHTPVFPAPGASVTLPLGPAGVDRPAAIMKAQDDFYESFGYFTLSFATTGILYGIYSGFQQSFVAAGRPAGSSLATVGMVFYVSFWGGVAVTSGLLGWSGYRLFLYINTAG